MKRFLAILTAMVLLCGTCLLTACGVSVGKDNNGDDGKKDEPVGLYTVVKEATEKTLAATAYEAKSVFVMDTEMFGTKMNTTSDLVFTCNGKEVGVDGKSVVEMMGSKTETPCRYYYDGEWLYMTMLGENYKMLVTDEEFKSQAGHPGEYIAVLPEALFEGITGTADNIELTVDDATMKSLYGKAIGDHVGEEVDDLSQITIKDGKITLSVKDGYLATFNVAYTCEITMGEEDTVTYACSQATTFTKYGDVTVTPMEGYEDFEEMDDDSLFGDDDLAWDDDDLFEDDDFIFEDDELLFEDEL